MTAKLIKLRPKAEIDLEDIYDYSIKNFGIERAQRYLEDLHKAFQKLADNPQISREQSFIRPGLLAYSVVSHVIFFKAFENEIIIQRILHKSMNYSQHL